MGEKHFRCTQFSSSRKSNRRRFNTDETEGVIRHPIYASIIYFAVVGTIANLSVVSISLFLLLVAGCFIRIFTEEKYLKIKYPEYKEYSVKTKRIIPFIL